jgi:hypothetical protein
VNRTLRISYGIILTWLFILAVTTADVSFFWVGRESAQDWELNPVALAAVRFAGMGGLILYRGTWVAFAWLMACTRARLAWIITPVWGVAHFCLLILLIQATPPLLEALAVRAGLELRPIPVRSIRPIPRTGNQRSEVRGQKAEGRRR